MPIDNTEQTRTCEKVGAIILAAGFSRRFGGTKLAVSLPTGRTVLQQTFSNVHAAIPDVLVVTRPALYPLLADQAENIAVFGEAAEGMGASLAFGVKTILGHDSQQPEGQAARGQTHPRSSGHFPAGAGWDACLVCLGDMPFIRPQTYRAVSQAIRPGTIVVPYHDGQPGNPAGFDRLYFPALAGLNGDQGGRQIVKSNPQAVIRLDLDDPAILQDIDTPSDLPHFDGPDS